MDGEMAAPRKGGISLFFPWVLLSVSVIRSALSRGFHGNILDKMGFAWCVEGGKLPAGLLTAPPAESNHLKANYPYDADVGCRVFSSAHHLRYVPEQQQLLWWRRWRWWWRHDTVYHPPPCGAQLRSLYKFSTITQWCHGPYHSLRVVVTVKNIRSFRRNYDGWREKGGRDSERTESHTRQVWGECSVELRGQLFLVLMWASPCGGLENCPVTPPPRWWRWWCSPLMMMMNAPRQN